ncbi:TonB-dependent receptor [Chitinophagaceae bacterium 26-R-25]|nr:TonB-dependent receptor [Chitinophagaceae bacterium 26-R-25]
MSTTIKKKSVVRQRRLNLFGVLLLLLTVCSNMLYAQTNNVKITGTVTDDAGKALQGVTIAVGAHATSTNSEGAYSITVPAKSTLTFTYVGFLSISRKVGEKDDILSIKMESKTKEMEQVVVVGYGTQKKKDVTGSVTTVNEKALREVPATNIAQALQGRAAGLDIQETGTKPGDGVQIRIRGVRSIAGSNSPLIVLDGIPFGGSLNDINPDDISSVDVLKDASATAIYGSRGSNGVIIVTTKRGKNGEAKVSYSGYYGIGKVGDYKYPVFNGDQYKASRDISSWTAGYMPDEITSLQTGRRTDWQDLMYETAHKTDNNLTVSGGSNGSNYSLGGGYYKQDAVLPGQDFTRYSLRGTIDSKIGKKTRVGLNTMNSYSITNGSQFVNPLYNMLTMSPLMPAYNADGSINVMPSGNTIDQPTTYSPLLLKNNNNNWVDKVRRMNSFNSLFGEYEFIPGLKYRINVGLNFSQQENDQFQGTDSKTNPNYFRPGQGNTASVNNAETWMYLVENMLMYEKTFKQDHRINFTGLYSVEESQTHNTYIQKDSITDDFTQFYNLAMSSPNGALVYNGAESKYGLISYMARLNYAYKDKYLLTGTYRRDGSSRLASGNKWHDYFAGSAGWIISNEKFLKNAEWLNSLKLRAGFGQTSNQSVNPYASLGSVNNSDGVPFNGGFGTIKYNYGPSVVSGYAPNTLPNSTLDWEYTKNINVGVDFAVFNSRLTGSLEYYKQNTNKVLYDVALPVTSGISGNYQTNIGEIQNWGMELSLSSVNLKMSNGFTWTTDLNLFFNKNKVVRLSSGVNQDVARQLFVGESMTSIWDFKKLGVWQTNEAKDAAVYGYVPGQLKLEDYNHDGKISQDDKHIIGNGDPKIQGGMVNRFNYKNFDLSVVMYGRFGGTLISQIHQSTGSAGSYDIMMNGRRNSVAVDYWTPTNATNWFPMFSDNISPNAANAWTTLGYYDASFLRISSINLGYTFSQKTLRRSGIQSVRVYATTDNVATLFSPYKNQTGITPIGTSTGDQTIGKAAGNIRSNTSTGNNTITINTSTPLTHNFILGLNLSF